MPFDFISLKKFILLSAFASASLLYKILFIFCKLHLKVVFIFQTQMALHYILLVTRYI
jgi:hypothetical protein